MLCGQTLLVSTMRPSCMHQRKGSCSKMVDGNRFNVTTTARKGPLTAAYGGALSRCSFCAALMHFAMVASGIQPSHSECVSAITGAKESKTGSSSSPAVISTIVTLFPCNRFARQDVTWDRDCCNCFSLSPATCFASVIRL